ncbi:hypothetical protein [Hymenobacter sp. HSC-4F20]|nr:hypothetical protein [Hymenobacter sp. HSC-4F20]
MTAGTLLSFYGQLLRSTKRLVKVPRWHQAAQGGETTIIPSRGV